MCWKCRPPSEEILRRDDVSLPFARCSGFCVSRLWNKRTWYFRLVIPFQKLTPEHIRLPTRHKARTDRLTASRTKGKEGNDCHQVHSISMAEKLRFAKHQRQDIPEYSARTSLLESDTASTSGYVPQL